MPESFTEAEISASKKPIQKLRLLFAVFDYHPHKFTMASPHTVLTAIPDPLGECMMPDVARRVIHLRASAEASIRMHLLAGKSAQGTLSEEAGQPSSMPSGGKRLRRSADLGRRGP